MEQQLTLMLAALSLIGGAMGLITMALMFLGGMVLADWLRPRPAEFVMIVEGVGRQDIAKRLSPHFQKGWDYAWKSEGGRVGTWDYYLKLRPTLAVP